MLLPFVIALAASFAVPSFASADYTPRKAIYGLQERSSPQGVAVEQSTGNAFIVDEGQDGVFVAAPDGLGAVPLTQFGAGELTDPYGIAIDESTGQTRVYVGDAGNDRIVRFLSDGAATPSFTVDPSYTSPALGAAADEIEDFASPLALAPNGDLWVADRGANVVKRFDPTGAHVGGSNFDGSGSPEGSFTGLRGIAVNSEGDLYVVDATGEIRKSEGVSRVQRFAASGTYKSTVGPLGPRSRSGSVAVNPADDSIIVSGDQDGVSHDDFLGRLYRFDADGASLEEFTIEHSGGSVRGIAFHATERAPVYIATGRNFWEGLETAGLPNVHVASERIPPLATIDPPSDVGPNAASIGGTVDPTGIPTSVEVQYRTVGGATWASTGPRDIGSASASVPVLERVEGLAPATEYEARIQATSADGSAQTAPVSFTTDTRRPAVLAQSAIPGSDGATLRARIQTGGADTTYHFEYGTTTAYGQVTAEQAIPAQSAGVNVSAQITGLAPGTAYRFRVVAENENGSDRGEGRTFLTRTGAADNCPNAQYRTGAEAQLSDCRAYELVTPMGAQADLRVGGSESTPDARTVCFHVDDSMLDSDPNGIKLPDDGFCSWRAAGGWQTKWVTGPAPVEERRFSQAGSNVYFLSPDGQRLVFASDTPLLSRDWISTVQSSTAQMRSYSWEAGVTRELSPPRPLVIPGVGELFLPEENSPHRRPLAASEDTTRGVFESTLNLVDEDTNFVADLYEWGPDGMRVVSRDSSGMAAGGNAPFVHAEQLQFTNLVSKDGSRIFFQHKGLPLDEDADPAEAPNSVSSVYMREGDEVVLVSPRRGSGPAADATFMAASGSGEVVYLASTQQLTTEPKLSGPAIYRYRVGADELKLVASRPGGVEFLKSSDDGSTVVYRALSSNQALVLRDGHSEPLGTVSADDLDRLNYQIANEQPDRRALRITPDGSVVVFASSGEFAGSAAGVVRVYRWAEGEGVESISSTGSGEPTEGASIGAYPGGLFSPRMEVLAAHRKAPLEGRVISDDGSRVFFETPEALVDRDVNGEVDVYEWHDDEVSLVSTGTGGRALYHDSSADGKTVFFTTFNRLEPEFDRNNNRDLYVAQPNGGFDPPPAPEKCEGDGCQPARSAPAAPQGAAGGGNVPLSIEVKRLNRAQLRALAGKGRTTVTVTVGVSGRLTATLRGRLGKRKAVAARRSTSVTVSQPRTVRLSLQLNPKARSELARRGKLRLKLTVAHSVSGEIASQEVVLRG